MALNIYIIAIQRINYLGMYKTTIDTQPKRQPDYCENFEVKLQSNYKVK